MSIVPTARPEMTKDTALQMLSRGIVDTSKPALLGRRGYYRDSMGVPGRNDQGIYDDAIFFVSPDAFMACNANTDPNVNRKGIATLRTGVWKYAIGIHGITKPKERQYTALVQAAPVWVERADSAADFGFFGINIHRGGDLSTSSEGCQTIYPSQWPAFINLVQSQLLKFGVKTIPYYLTAR